MPESLACTPNLRARRSNGSHSRAIEAMPHCSMRAAEMGASEILQALRLRSGSG
jgi:hypothetical protein